LTNIIFSLAAGKAADYIPKKYIIITGLILYSVNGIGGGFSNSIEVLLLNRALLGAGAGMVAPFVNDLIAYFFEGEERTSMVGYATSASNLSGIFIPLLAGWLAGFNWRYAFMVYAIGFLVLLITLLFIPVIPVKKDEQNENANPLSHSKDVWKIALTNLLIMILFYTIPTNISMFVQQEGIGNATTAALANSVSTLVSTLAGLLFSKFYSRYKQRLFLIGLVFCSLGFIVIALMHGIVPLFLSEFLVGLGFGFLFPLFSLNMIQVTSGNETTRALSLLSSSFSMGIFFSPMFFLVTSKLAGSDSIRTEFYIAALFFSGWCLLTALKKKKTRTV
jgi:MFS family permease